MDRREIIKISIVAAASAGLAFWAGRKSRSPSGRYVQFGTSLTSGAGTKLGGMIPAMVGQQLGIEGINAGCPGSCAGDHKAPEMDPVSLFALVNAIVSGDWSTQQTNKTGQWSRDIAISNLMTVGFETVSHVGLEYGPNDYRYDRPIGDDFDVRKETFKGALNHSIQVLLRRYPKIRVFLITPWWMPTFDGGDSDQFPNEASFFLRDYVAAIHRVAELNRVPCLDLWSTSGVSKMNYRDFTVDGLHLNDAGAVRRANIIANFVRALI